MFVEKTKRIGQRKIKIIISDVTSPGSRWQIVTLAYIRDMLTQQEIRGEQKELARSDNSPTVRSEDADAKNT